MSVSSSSGDEGVELPELNFPVLEPVPRRAAPSPRDAERSTRQIIELSERLLPLETARPDFEERRLAMKRGLVPFSLSEEGPRPTGDG